MRRSSVTLEIVNSAPNIRQHVCLHSVARCAGSTVNTLSSTAHILTRNVQDVLDAH
ncbi:hypothetical protein AZE42_00465, partial [Rhizopogon vesiculosus]